MLSRRRAVLAALLGAVSRLPGAKKQGPYTFLSVEIPATGPDPYDHRNQIEVQYALEIIGDGRVVRFTPGELMDILENKPELDPTLVQKVSGPGWGPVKDSNLPEPLVGKLPPR